MRSLKRRLLWVVPLVLVCLAALGYGALTVNKFLEEGRIATAIETRNTQVVNAITETQQVSLLSLGIEGLAEQTAKRTILGMEVPGSGRAMFLQYSFTAKLGLDGEDVEIKQTGEQDFTISVPEFVFIGHDEVNFRLVTEKNGILSWATPEIDTLEMANEILNDEARQKYLDSNDALLREQTVTFYEGIITGIDPTLTLEFDFGPGR